MITYELETTISGQEIIRRIDNDVETIIPVDESNADYQRYLRHLAGEDEAQSL